MSQKHTSVISFRVTPEDKETFIQKCDVASFIPSKYAPGNTLRKFIQCYIQNPRYFENIFNKFAK